MNIQVLDRDTFREQVFKRDKNCCVLCGKPSQDAHHIMERRLFDDGGYYLDNGASLCGECHLKAEFTTVSPEEIRLAAGIIKRKLPEHLYEDYSYDKWGNIVNSNGTRVKGELFEDLSVQKALKLGNVLDKFSNYIKYPRTYHLPCSPGKSDDDKVLKDYSNFNNKDVVATVKMDGENTTAYWDGYIHARSLDSQNHESRNWVKNYLSSKIYELPRGWRICGENLYAKHAIHYSNLGSYFYLFSIWNERNECLSWKETVEWAAMLEMSIVPVIYDGLFDQNTIQNLYTPNFNGNKCEGFVLRNKDSFPYCNFRKNVGKYVRAEHVVENQHWMRASVVKNSL